MKSRIPNFWKTAVPEWTIVLRSVFGILAVWNEFILAQLVLQSRAKMPLQLGVGKFWGGVITEYPLLNAGMTISIIPIVIAYIFLQRHIVAGITAGAVKG